jgi:hypothetical protein
MTLATDRMNYLTLYLLLPKDIFTESKTFFDKFKACSRRFENSSRLTADSNRFKALFFRCA